MQQHKQLKLNNMVTIYKLIKEGLKNALDVK